MGNRANRRHPAKTVPIAYIPTDRIILEEVQKEMMLQRTAIIKDATDQVLNVFIVALHDEMDFGKTRIQRVLDKAKELLECVEYGTVSLDDLQELVKSFGVSVE